MQCYLGKMLAGLSTTLILLAIVGTLADSSIKGPPHVSSHVDRIFSHPLGSNVKLDCPIDGTPKPMLYWFKDGESINAGSWLHIRQKGQTLRIQEAGLEDSGIYVCKGVNGFGSQEIALTLRIYDPHSPSTTLRPLQRLPAGTLGIKPTFTSISRSSVLTSSTNDSQLVSAIFRRAVGSNLILYCAADGVPEPKLIWYKDDYAISSDVARGIILTVSSSNATLHFPNLSLDDSGNYTCKASNAFGTINSTFVVRIVDRALSVPEIVSVTSLNSSTVSRGDTAVLVCRVSSEVIPQVRWLKKVDQQEALASSDRTDVLWFDGTRYRVLDSRSGSGETEPDPAEGTFLKKLHVVSANSMDSGVYVCMATNERGYQHGYTTLTVLPASTNEPLPLSVIVSLPVGLTFALVLLMSSIYLYCRHRRRRNRRKTKKQKEQQRLQDGKQSVCGPSNPLRGGVIMPSSVEASEALLQHQYGMMAANQQQSIIPYYQIHHDGPMFCQQLQPPFAPQRHISQEQNSTLSPPIALIPTHPQNQQQQQQQQHQHQHQQEHSTSNTATTSGNSDQSRNSSVAMTAALIKPSNDRDHQQRASSASTTSSSSANASTRRGGGGSGAKNKRRAGSTTTSTRKSDI